MNILKNIREALSRVPTELSLTPSNEIEFNSHTVEGADESVPAGKFILPKGTKVARIHWTGNGRHVLEYSTTTKPCQVDLLQYNPVAEYRNAEDPVKRRQYETRGFTFAGQQFLIKVK